MRQPLPPRWRAPVEGERAKDLIEALAAAVEQRTEIDDVEARERVHHCNRIRRSQANREAALLAAEGRCAGCRRLWGRHFGNYALDVHHSNPLANMPPTQLSVTTRVRDLIVLCPTCHRLIHKQMDAPEPLDALQAELAVFHAHG